MKNKSIYLEIESKTAMQSFTEMRTAYEFDETLCEFELYELRNLTHRQTASELAKTK